MGTRSGQHILANAVRALCSEYQNNQNGKLRLVVMGKKNVVFLFVRPPVQKILTSCSSEYLKNMQTRFVVEG